MIVASTSTIPKPNELIELLKREFSSKYSFKLFGLSSKPTIVVSWWWITGAQITIHENEIRVQEPSTIRAFVTSVIRYATGFAMPFNPWKKKLQQQLTTVLERKYT